MRHSRMVEGASPGWTNLAFGPGRKPTYSPKAHNPAMRKLLEAVSKEYGMRAVQQILCLFGRHAPDRRHFQDENGRLLCRCSGCGRRMVRDHGVSWTVAQ